jgi:hypothetical protein
MKSNIEEMLVKSFTLDSAKKQMQELVGSLACPNGIHVDFGGGLAARADVSEEAIDLKYINVEWDDQFNSFRRSDHQESLTCDGLVQSLVESGVSSVSIEKLPADVLRCRKLLAMARQVLAARQGVLVIAVENSAFADSLVAEAFSSQVSPLGTHLRANDAAVTQMLAEEGFHEIRRQDLQESSIQFDLARDTVLASQSVTTRQFLYQLLQQSSPHARTKTFVRAFLPGPSIRPLRTELADDSPFLSIVMRTQGNRLDALAEVILCLAGQTCQDFELLIVGHKVPKHNEALVLELIQEFPECIRSKMRYISVSHGERATPLNVGFTEARGRYISILDDDDLPFAHWVETFAALAKARPGTVLRTVVVKQNYAECRSVNGMSANRAVGGLENCYGKPFSLIDHLQYNRSPNNGLSFPGSLIRDLGFRFDESLTTVEDWDFLLRTAMVCGVANSSTVTTIYRWWTTRDSSRTEHSTHDWKSNEQHVLRKFDNIPILLPAGSARELRQLYNMAYTVSAAATHVEPPIEPPVELEQKLNALLQSRSWRVSAPLRKVLQIALGHPASTSLGGATREELLLTIQAIQLSTSWRLTAPLRWLSNAVRSCRRARATQPA